MSWKSIEGAGSTGPEYISSSQISMYLRCARQYYFRYVKGVKKPPTLSMAIGTSVHKSAEINYAHKLKTKTQVSKDIAMDAYDMAFKEAKLDADVDEPENNAKDRGYRMSEAHYTQIAPLYQPLEKPEFEFTVPIPGIKRQLYGFIDLIAASVGKVGKTQIVSKKRQVRDNKTAGRKYDSLSVEISGQLTAYAYVHKVLFGKLPDSVGLDIAVAKKKSETVEVQIENTVRTEPEVKRFLETVVQVENGINAGVFPPCDDQRVCSWCGYRDECLGPAAKRANIYQP